MTQALYAHMNNKIIIIKKEEGSKGVFKNSIISWALVAHACNPSYLGGKG
jgi:hypothetical protein